MVASNIEEAIREKKFQSGDKLPSELELCSQFGVSRTAVREALQMLSAKGLISIIKGKGIYVNGVTSAIVTNPLHLYLQMMNVDEYVLDLVHARQIIEPPIAALAAIHHSKEDIEKLEINMQDLQKCEGDFSDLAQIDMFFHLEIAKASKNQIMPLILDPIHKLMPEIKSSVYATNKDAKASAIEWHRKILNEIKKRDPDSARKAMQQHLTIAEEHAKKMLLIQKSKPSQ